MATTDDRPSDDRDRPTRSVAHHISDETLRSWFTYVAPSGEAIELHQDVRQEFREVALFLNHILPEGPSKTLALRGLETAAFHANAAIAREPRLHDQPA